MRGGWQVFDRAAAKDCHKAGPLIRSSFFRTSKFSSRMFIYIAAAVFCLVISESPRAQSPAPKVTIGIGAGTLGHIPLVVASEKDYFRDEGIRVELIQIKAGLNVPAIMEGGLDYSGIIGIPANAALRGMNSAGSSIFSAAIVLFGASAKGWSPSGTCIFRNRIKRTFSTKTPKPC
jgi:ABC-type nitrate/sulfonate/bicarbonate transport system substrate-binding protein